MFSEAYLAHPLHQLLNNAFPGRVHAAVVPPVLAAQHKEAGKKPRVDFAVLSDDGPFEVVVEAKWVSESHALLRDILRGVVRLDMLMPTHAKETLLILAGQGRYITGALQSLAIQAASWPFGQYAHSPPCKEYHESTYGRLIEKNHPFRALDASGPRWAEIGTKEDLIEAEKIPGGDVRQLAGIVACMPMKLPFLRVRKASDRYLTGPSSFSLWDWRVGDCKGQ